MPKPSSASVKPSPRRSSRSIAAAPSGSYAAASCKVSKTKPLRVIPDERAVIVATVNECRAAYDYVFRAGRHPSAASQLVHAKGTITWDGDLGEVAPLPKFAPEQLGDCIDCTICVQVCPTGIDIRNGTQMECVNCTACIDACDGIMEKIGKPPGLIRYASLNSIENGDHFKFTARMGWYSVVIFVLAAVLGVLVFTRSDVETMLLRAPGGLFTETEAGTIQNLYTLKVVNKTSRDIPLELKLEDVQGTVKIMGSGALLVPKEGLAQTDPHGEAVAAGLFAPAEARNLAWVQRHRELYEEALRRVLAFTTKRGGPHSPDAAEVRAFLADLHSGPISDLEPLTGQPWNLALTTLAADSKHNSRSEVKMAMRMRVRTSTPTVRFSRVFGCRSRAATACSRKSAAAG